MSRNVQMDMSATDLTHRRFLHPNIATVTIRVTHFQQTLYRTDYEEETIIDMHPAIQPPSANIFFFFPFSLISASSTLSLAARHYVFYQLFPKLNGDRELCESMASRISSLARRMVDHGCRRFHLSVKAEVVGVELIHEADERRRLEELREKIPRGMNQEEDEVGECGICLEEMMMLEGKQVREMPCRHNFHEECVLEWLKSSNTCPLCRQAVDVASCTLWLLNFPEYIN